MTATILHFPNPLAKAFAAIEHGIYWAIQAYAADRYQRLVAADDMLRAAFDTLLEDGYAQHAERAGQ